MRRDSVLEDVEIRMDAPLERDASTMFCVPPTLIVSDSGRKAARRSKNRRAAAVWKTVRSQLALGVRGHGA